MALSVIGAGFGRTGTESMKGALEVLGLGRCHHMIEVIPDEAQKSIWRGIAAGGAPDWDAAFNGFGCAVDWPSAAYWRETAAHFPDAKVLLTVRDSAKWWESINSTIFEILRLVESPDSVGTALIKNQVFGGNIEDRDHVIATYEKNIADVQAAFGPERLLTYELGAGWGPLCEFLELPAPDQEFPRVNSTAEFQKYIAMFRDGQADLP